MLFSRLGDSGASLRLAQAAECRYVAWACGETVAVHERSVIFLINHLGIIDGSGELAGSRIYLAIETYCGICDEPLVLNPEDQKYMLEIRRIPVKMLRRGAVFCSPCRQRRSRINWLRQHDRWRSIQGGAEERELLQSQEREALARSTKRYEHAVWPYPEPNV